MKSHNFYPKPQQKPIKYKEFIQQLQNSSRSSIQDQSMLSQRSFRQSYTAREFQDQIKNQTCPKSLKQSPFKFNHIQSSSNLSNLSSTQNQQRPTDPNDKLYTFCDAKLTERSVQIVRNSNSKTKPQKSHTHRQGTNPKYFKTNKQRTGQKENMDFVNQILQKIQSGGFQGKVLKTENSQLENLERSTQKSPESILMTKKQNDDSKIFANSINNSMNQSNSSRKIESVKKIFVLSKQPSSRVSNKKNNPSANLSEQKSRENSLKKTQSKLETEKQSQQKCSSKKKIVSLNINPLKNSVNSQQNNIKLRLCLDKSVEKLSGQKEKSAKINIQGRGNFNLSSRGSSAEVKLLSSSMQKIPSLNHSKIESLNEASRNNLMMSGTELSEITSNFVQKQSSLNQEVQKLRKTLEQYKEKEKKLGKEIYDLNQKLKHQNSNLQDKKQVQILQKDCTRLTNSYKEMKRLYQMTIKEKQEIESQMQSVMGENSDLKECLDFKSHEVNQLNQKMHEMSQHMEELQNELENRVFPSQLEGLSEMIKDKLSQYQNQISSLLDENHKLTLLREKLQNYNQTLKQEIEQKDSMINSLERHIRDISSLRRSCKDEIGDYRQNEIRLTKLCKELQSKLKLSSIHNQYLTQQIISLKHQKKRLANTVSDQSQLGPQILLNTPNAISSYGSSSSNEYKSNKLTSLNTLANTITTRNSSISHGKDHQFDHFINRLNSHKIGGQDREFIKENCTTQEHPQ